MKQTGIVKGIVYMDSDGRRETAPYASVTNKRTGQVVHSDENGKYSIPARANDEIHFSYVGYEPTRYKVSNPNKPYNAVLSFGSNVIAPVTIDIVVPKKKNNIPWGWIIGGTLLLGIIATGSKKIKKYTIE